MSFRLGNPQSRPATATDAVATDTVATDAAVAESLASRVRALRRAWARSARQTLVLLGAGHGGLAASLASDPAVSQAQVVVLEPDPDHLRTLASSGGLKTLREPPNLSVLTDSSPQALLCLPAMLGINRDTAFLALNPESDQAGTGGLSELSRLLRRASPVAAHAQDAPVSPPRLSVAAMIHPDEPGLARFFAQVPEWVHEVVVVWDGRKPGSAMAETRAGLVKSLVHPLGLDFAAQRNRLLAACQGDFVLMLDADEVIPPEGWEALARLAASRLAAGYLLPRHTPLPGVDAIRVGYGLWPDLQLRLFERQPGLTFERPVHERLTGLVGVQAIVLDVAIRHEAYLRKDREAIEAKLSRFDLAGGGLIRHMSSREYPSLPGHMIEVHMHPDRPRLLALG